MRRKFGPEAHAAGGTRDFGAFGKIAGDGLSHALHLGGVKAANLAQMMVVAAVLKELSNGHLRQRGSSGGVDEFQEFDFGFETSGSNPADAIAGRQSFGERIAVQHPAVFIKSFGDFWPRGVESQIPVDIVFDEWNFAVGKYLDEFLFLFVGHATAERIAVVEREDAGFDTAAF